MKKKKKKAESTFFANAAYVRQLNREHPAPVSGPSANVGHILRLKRGGHVCGWCLQPLLVKEEPLRPLFELLVQNLTYGQFHLLRQSGILTDKQLLALQTVIDLYRMP